MSLFGTLAIYFFFSLNSPASGESEAQRLLNANLKSSQMTAELIEMHSTVPNQQEIVGDWGCVIVSGINSLNIGSKYPRQQVLSLVKNGDQSIFEMNEGFPLVRNEIGWMNVNNSNPTGNVCMLSMRKDTERNNLFITWSCPKSDDDSKFHPYGVEDDRVRVVEYGICESLSETAL